MIYGVILAGGQSSRFGGQDKGFIQFRQKTMIESVIDVLRPQVDDLLISANANLDAYQQFGHPVIQDNTPGFYGPLMGIYSVMEFIHSNHPSHSPHQHINLLIVPCDMPLLPHNLKEQLLKTQNHPQQATIVREGNRLQPLVMLLPLSHSSNLKRYLECGNAKVTDWVLSINPAVSDFSPQTGCFDNINSARELAETEKHHANN